MNFRCTAAVLMAATIGAIPATAGDKDEESKDQTRLTIGDEAPELAIASWVKGEEFALKEGQIYVVEFWKLVLLALVNPTEWSYFFCLMLDA